VVKIANNFAKNCSKVMEIGQNRSTLITNLGNETYLESIIQASFVVIWPQNWYVHT
jgi:hypothetical protein